MSSWPWIIFSKLLLLQALEAYKALVIFPLPSKSHSILGDSLVDLIAGAGNEVTYLTSFPRTNPPARVKEITVLEEKHKKMWTDGLNLKAVMDGKVNFNNLINFIKTINGVSLLILQNKDMQILMNDPNEKFDVIIAEWLYSDIYAGLTPVFDCPLIWLSSMEQHWSMLRLIDDIPNPAYSADITFINLPPFTFVQRVLGLWFQVLNFLLDYFYTSTLHKVQYGNIIAPIISRKGKIVPQFEELKFNASLVLGNSHVSLGSAAKLPMNYKPIAGYHISKNLQPLTDDLKSLLNNSKHGVIYFSLGSNLKSKSFPNNLKNSLLNMFGGLKQTVLWKFEEDIPHKPSNVHITQWAPQKSILAHQNCLLFITHGGFLSMIEAIHFGKPLIGIPVYGDQFGNIAKAVQKGFAKRVDLSYTMADKLQVAIQEVITNPSYADKAKEFSFIYFHRPVPPAVEILHWIEHIVKTQGALHLRSPALPVRWYQKMYLDLILVILVSFFALKILITRICAVLCRKQRSKIKKS